jgi:uncharacterized protein YbjT (DUF2867 family)
MTRKEIVVFGATGAQGGGLVSAMLRDDSGAYGIRAVTRQLDGEKARALRELGVAVVQADLDNLSSVERAMDGVWGAFCVTSFWEHFSPQREQTQANNLAVAAARAKVGHVVWSTLEDTRDFVPADGRRMPVLSGSYNVPHFDAKGASDRFFVENSVPTTFLRTSFYWENFINFGLGPVRDGAGPARLRLSLGQGRLPGIGVDDIGPCALAIFRDSAKWAGATVGISGEQLTGAQMAAELAFALGEAVEYSDLTPEEFRGLGFAGADDLGNMFQFQAEFQEAFCGVRDPEQTRKLHPGLMTFREWLSRHGPKVRVL